MKIRTDFVTNSSSSSFVTVKIDSKKITDFLKKKKRKIEGRNSGWCDVELSFKGSSVTVQSGDRDVYFSTPLTLEDFSRMFFDGLLSLSEDEEYKVFAADLDLKTEIKTIDWSTEILGLDGDDGRYDRDSYTDEKLEELLEEIADMNECNVDEITDEMFREYVEPDDWTATEWSKYTYDCETQISSYKHETIMEENSSQIKE